MKPSKKGKKSKKGGKKGKKKAVAEPSDQIQEQNESVQKVVKHGRLEEDMDDGNLMEDEVDDRTLAALAVNGSVSEQHNLISAAQNDEAGGGIGADGVDWNALNKANQEQIE